MRTLVVIWVVAAAVAGCGGRARVQRPGEEYLSAIRIEGNRTIDADELVPGLVLERARKGRRAIDPYQLTLDVDRIRAAYVRLGFFDAKVTARVETRPDRQMTAQTVVFDVVEGPRARTSVVFRGLPPEVPEARARALIALRDGDPFVYAAYDAAKLPLVTLIEDAGYPHVQIDAAVLADRATGIATARFDVVPGPRAAFGAIEIEGVDGQLADAIRGRLAFSSGDPYSSSALVESQRAVTELGRFATVRFVPDRTAGTTVPVRISVVRARLREARIGGGVGVDQETFEARLRLGYSTVLSALPLWSFGFDLRPALGFYEGDTLLKLRARASAYRLELLRPRMRGEIEVAADYLDFEAYTVSGPQLRVGISSPLGPSWLRGRVGWVLEYLWFTNVKLLPPAPTELGLDEDQRRGAYELSVDADLRDNPLEATRGVYASLRAVLGTPYAGGAGQYTQLTPEVRGYLPLWWDVVLAARARLGLLGGDVPVTERYYSGGASKHRGFAERQLSPRAPGLDSGELVDLPIGGEALLETGLELRIPLGTAWDLPVGTELFVDGGDVVATPGTVDASNLYWAAGAGIYLSFFGVKARAGVGELLTRRTESGLWANKELYIAVGDAY